MYKKLSFIIATLFGFGRFPKAPGTVGSLASVPIAMACAYFYGFEGILIASIVSSVIGTLAIKEVLKTSKHDPSFVVIDETAGLVLSFIFVANYLQGNLGTNAIILYAVGFVAFRVFDISKPLLVGWADKKVGGATGVMLDDIFAGLFAAIIVLLTKMYVL